MSGSRPGRIQTARIPRLSEDLPAAVEIVDTPERIEAFLPVLAAAIGEQLVMRASTPVIAYRHRQDAREAGGRTD